MCVCLLLASNCSESVEVIIIRLGTVTASDMKMHHVLIIYIIYRSCYFVHLVSVIGETLVESLVGRDEQYCDVTEQKIETSPERLERLR